MIKIINKEDCFAIAYDGQEFAIGRIRHKKLQINSPSRFRPTNAYGIDMEVLTSAEMDYDIITIRERHKDWETTKAFWLEHGKVIDINNGRIEMYLPDRLFGLDKAIAYRAFMEPETQKLCKMDIFDVGVETASEGWPSFDKLLAKWQVANDIAQEYIQAVTSNQKLKL